MEAQAAERVTDLAALPWYDTGPLSRALYSSDASLYRVVPRGVARPRDAAELITVLDAARAAGLPVTTRGAGTSIAGNAVGTGVIVDCRALDRILDLDPGNRLAVVEPGVVQARLTATAQPHGLRFGPDPSTSDRCTIGGMIGNNACGPRALGYGRTADNVIALDVVTGTGERLTIDSRRAARDADSPTLRALQTLVRDHLGLIRTESGRFSRQVSGYSLEHLLPENGFNVAAFLAGSEGTLATVTRATVRLVPDPPHTVIVALGYADMAAAADAVGRVLPFRPTACEGLDRRIIDVITRARGVGAVPPLPTGDGWMLVELADADPSRLEKRAADLVAAAGALDGFAIEDPGVARALWRIRADGAGLAAVALDRPAHAGWEDAAVPPQRLGAYLRDFEALLAAHGLAGIPYGHFGEGCVHVRIDFPLDSPEGAHRYRSFIEAAADLVAAHGGSMSGEHGDGRARSELLPRMYSPTAIALFAAVKHIFDPQNLLNPGVLVDPRPIDADLRLVAVHASPLARLAPRFAADVHRCTGVGKCLADRTAEGGVMCPSYQATGQDKDSTRGRARVLQEMVNGTLVRQGWRSPEVREALELCLACKGCAADCPTGTDIARYKSEVLDRAYRGRLRPRSHYLLGRLPQVARLVTAAPWLAQLVNRLAGTRGLRPVIAWVGGLDARRSLPRFALRPARRLGTDRSALPGSGPRGPLGSFAWEARAALRDAPSGRSSASGAFRPQGVGKGTFESGTTLRDAPSGRSLGTTPRDAPSGRSSGTTPRDAPSGRSSGTTTGDAPSGRSSGTTPRDAPSGRSPGTTPRDAPSGRSSGTTPRDAPSGRSPGTTPRDAPSGHSPGTTTGDAPSGHSPGTTTGDAPSGRSSGTTPRAGRPVAVWVDSFSDCFEGSPLPALLTVLSDAGWSPTVIDRPACCGLTLVTTGQRDAAARVIRASLRVLHPIVAAGIPIVGMEPSCLATWRSDAADLVDDPRVAEVAAGVRTLAELLTGDPDWRPPDLSGHTIVVQPHCHHASVLGWDADARLLADTGAEVVRVGGCCGLAGNFGVEKGHYEVSVKVAEHDLLPAVAAAGPGAIVLADGFSCRTQLADLTGRRALTLAELLAGHPR